MPASYAHLAVHIVFSTHNHKTWLKPEIRDAMHSYLAAIINRTGGKAIKVGGTQDHIHILCLLPKNLSPGEFMAKIKANSSKWIREKHFPDFHWQDGYGLFSVSKSDLNRVKDYIENQLEHHYNLSAWEEFDRLLARHQEE